MKDALLIGFIILILFLVSLATFGCHRVPEPVYDLTPITPQIQTIIKNIGWVQGALIIGVVGSIFACFNGAAKFGIPLLISCLVGYGLTSAMLFYSKIIAISSLVGGLGLCGYMIFVKQRALKEIIDTVEYFKERLVITGQEVPGGRDIKPETKQYVKNIIQSPSTTKLVTKIKNGK